MKRFFPLLLILLAGLAIHAQNSPKTGSSCLYDQFDMLETTNLASRLDGLFLKLTATPGAKGHILMIFSKVDSKAFRESYLKRVTDAITSLKKYSERVTIGYGPDTGENEGTTKLWVLPADSNINDIWTNKGGESIGRSKNTVRCSETRSTQ